MFGLFSRNNKNICPIDPGMRLWVENAFLWLATQFGHENIANKQMLFPTPEYFPVNFDGSQQSLNDTAAIVARQMEIDIKEIWRLFIRVFWNLTVVLVTGYGLRLIQVVNKKTQQDFISRKMKKADTMYSLKRIPWEIPGV